MPESILDEIVAYTRRRVAREMPLSPTTSTSAPFSRPPFSSDFPFEKAIAEEGLSFICEVKKASPSKGVIAKDYPYVEIALAYEKAGASAISVLTEPKFFLGEAKHLAEIAAAVNIPVLRKDFVVDEYQIYETAGLGASAVLLITSILNDNELAHFLKLAERLGLSALVETRNEEEINRALAAGARIIGVNNRNLKTFAVDIKRASRLRSLVSGDALFVSESGITGPEDVRALLAGGAKPDALLIGEAMMRAEDKAGFLKELKEASRA